LATVAGPVRGLEGLQLSRAKKNRGKNPALCTAWEEGGVNEAKRERAQGGEGGGVLKKVRAGGVGWSWDTPLGTLESIFH